MKDEGVANPSVVDDIVVIHFELCNEVFDGLIWTPRLVAVLVFNLEKFRRSKNVPVDTPKGVDEGNAVPVKITARSSIIASWSL